jgi:hypothetical protein
MNARTGGPWRESWWKLEALYLLPIPRHERKWSWTRYRRALLDHLANYLTIVDPTTNSHRGM